MRRILITKLLLLCLCTPSFADEEHTREQLTQVKRQIANLQKTLKKGMRQRSAEQQALRTIELEIGATARSIRSTERKVAENRAQLTNLKKRQQELNQLTATQQRKIKQQIRDAFVAGRSDQLKLLLSQQQPETVSRALVYYDYFNRARQQQIQEYLEWAREVEQVRSSIQQRQQTLQQQLASLEQTQQQQQRNRLKRENSLKRILASIQSDQQRLSAVKLERKELEELLSAMQEALADLALPSSFRPFKELKGKLPLPIRGRLRNAFGQPRYGSKLHWQGVQLAAKEGTSVTAIHYGRVVFADWFKGMGLLIILDHGDGYMSLYAHNESLLRETGEWVEAGDSIATVGNSGGRQESALYFEIRHNGTPTDPLNWCRRG